MADYKRLVSYMYNYEDGQKGTNVGYARVESRNGKCMVYIRIRVPSLSGKDLKVYFFKRDGYSIEGIPLGVLSVKNGVGQFRTSTDSNNIMSTSYTLEDIGGMVLYYSDEKYFATEWDDKPITKEMVNNSLLVPREKEVTKSKDEAEEKVENLIREGDTVGEKEVLETVEKLEEIEKVGEVEPVEKTEKTEKIELVDDIEKTESEVFKDHSDKEGKEEIEQSPIESASKKDTRDTSYGGNRRKTWPVFEEHPDALKIYDRFPKMYPFEDNEIAWCVRIEPQDIGLLPMENWALGNNSFLLHGFYCYSHLIFARINDKDGIKYILGVPGIYHNRERFMARMFGFDFFKSIKRKELRTGEFGYWYAPIYFS